jgi:hypothetical protein
MAGPNPHLSTSLGETHDPLPSETPNEDRRPARKLALRVIHHFDLARAAGIRVLPYSTGSHDGVSWWVMQPAQWQFEVARLLEEAAEALRNGRQRRTFVALGTAVAYVERARAGGDAFATELMSHTLDKPKEDPTSRFTFQPGELEALSVRPEKK